MFDPSGYLPPQYVIAWVAEMGERGELSRSLGFVHPGDEPRWDDLPAKTTARFVIGGKLAAGAFSAVAIVEPSGLDFRVPAHYWRDDRAAGTMESGRLDLSVLGLSNDFHIVRVLLEVDAVAAALGFRMMSPEEQAKPADRSLDDDWMIEYATRFVAKHRRPPGRDNEAVPDAQKAGLGINRARAAYTRLPANLRVANRKPKKT